MALSSYSALTWSTVSDRLIPASRWSATAAPPQLSTATTLPSYGRINAAAASCAYSILNHNRNNEAVEADPSFFDKGYCCSDQYNISHLDSELPNEYCDQFYLPYTYDDDLLDPASAFFSCYPAATDPPTLASCYEINGYDLPQQIPRGPELLDANYMPVVPPHQPIIKRHKPCYDPHPIIDQLSIRPMDVEEDETRPRQRKDVSAQSLAARERRKKITNKTHELGKLIPGGSKMNTAEMLQSASNYVKFLQSQVQILQLMPSPSTIRQEKDGGDEGKFIKERIAGSDIDMLRIVASPAVQEKLYKEASCIVPRSLAEDLIHQHPHLKGLHQLL